MDKTEYTSKRKKGRKEIKKVASLILVIDDDKDLERRKQLATVALYKLNIDWIKGNNLKTSTEIKLYHRLLKSMLLYNCVKWELTLSPNSTEIAPQLKIPREKNRVSESAKKIYCQYKSYRLAEVYLVIFYEESKTFPQIKQQEFILSLMVTNGEDDQRQLCQ